MMASIKKWLAPPVFEGDEEKTRRASFLNITLLSSLSFLGLAMFGLLFAAKTRAGIGFTLSVLFCFVLLLYYLLHHRKIALAGIGVMILAFFGVILVEIVNGHGSSSGYLGLSVCDHYGGDVV